MKYAIDRCRRALLTWPRAWRLARWVLVVLGGAAVLVLLARPAALAGELLSNVGPASQLQEGALMDAHPLGHYVLDHHFSAVKAGVLSGVDVSGIPPTIAWFLANTLWQLTAFLAHTLITLFTFAFSLDLVNGSGATGGASALEPVSQAVRSIYQRTFGEPWLIVAVLLAGLWAIYNALVRRRYVETAGSLAMSVLFVVIALAFVTAPERTIGSASKWSNTMSGAFLSLTSQGSVSDPDRAKQSAADQLFTLLVYEPWTVLQFGGREHCVQHPVKDKPQSVPVRPLSNDPGRDADLSRRLQRTEGVSADGKVCVSNRNKHAPRFLQHSSGSDERDKQYEALRDGDRSKLHDDDPAKKTESYRLGPADKPASSQMGKGGQYERLLMAIVIFAGELGIFLLLGALSISVILAQVLVLLLLAFAPIALVVGVFPGRGHAFFLGWLARLASLLLRKAIYSLVLAVLLAVGAAINEASSSLGWLMAFGLQAAFYWATFLTRGQLVGQLTLATTGPRSGADNQAVRIAALYSAAGMARRMLPGRHRGSGPVRGPRPSGPPAPAHAPQQSETPADVPNAVPDGGSRLATASSPGTTVPPSTGASAPVASSETPDRPGPGSDVPSEAPQPRVAVATPSPSGGPMPSGEVRADATSRSGSKPARGEIGARMLASGPRTDRPAESARAGSNARRTDQDQRSDQQPPNASEPALESASPTKQPDLSGRSAGTAPTEQVAAPRREESRSPLERELRSDARRLRERPVPEPPKKSISVPPARRRKDDR